MALFFDLHNHSLCGVDDGAHDFQEMTAMLETAYADGIRAICFTPHYSPYHYGDTFESSSAAFETLRAYATDKYPDLQLFLGHELGFYPACPEALRAGRCRSLAGSCYVLVDFPQEAEFSEIQKGTDLLMRNGYLPVLAHTERYLSLHRRLDWIEEFVESGGLVQVNASSACERGLSPIRRQWVRLLKSGLVHVISSDAHNLTVRPPLMSVCMPHLKKYCSEEEIRCLVWENAWRIVHNERF